MKGEKSWAKGVPSCTALFLKDIVVKDSRDSSGNWFSEESVT